MRGTLLLNLCFSCCLSAQTPDKVMTIYGGTVDAFDLHRRTDSQEARAIYRIKNNTKFILWESPLLIRERFVSPDQLHIAVVTEDSLERGAAVNFSHSFHLIVIDSAGNLIRQIDDGLRPSWSPDGKKLAYIKALRIEEGMGYSPTMSCIYELGASKETQLEFKTYDLNWVAADHLVYHIDFRTGRVKTYDPETGTFALSTKRGIYVSPDGNYYFCPNYEGGEFALYSDNDQDITAQLLKSLGIRNVQRAEWVEGHTLLLRNHRGGLHAENRSFLYDPQLGRAWEFKGTIVGPAGTTSTINLILPDGEIMVRSVKELKNLRE